MEYPKDFEAIEFFIPSEELRKKYFVTGLEVEYWFEPKVYGTFDYDTEEWAEILTNKPPIVYYVFEDDKCWVSKWTTTEQDFIEYKVAISRDTNIFTNLVNKAAKNKVTVP